MSLVALSGGLNIPIGISPSFSTSGATTTVVDAANEAIIYTGRIVTSDGGSHTIDTTGSSSLGWRTGSQTFADAATTVKVGLAAVETAAGPPVRAVNVADVITFDVSKSLPGNGGGITANTWHSHVPDSGSKTIANGDLVAFAVQMTARGGSDAVRPTYCITPATVHRPLVTSFVGAAYTQIAASPNAIITFSDGALGYFNTSEVFSSFGAKTWNSGSATKEYGQLFTLPFPAKIYGAFGYLDPDADCDIVLYSDPLGTPVAEKTVSIDANAVGAGSLQRFAEFFSSPYTVRPNQEVVIAFKPGASSVTNVFKTIASATHRITDVWGTTGYGVSRASGVFSNANSSLEHHYIGILVGAFEHGVAPTYALGL